MNQKKTTSRNADKFVIRLPDGLRDRISEVAVSNGRSMNSEIVRRLENSISDDLDSTELRKLTKILITRIEALEAQLHTQETAA
ncbi:Arc family DNA-binding protein [Pseudomonas asplenii]|uniref:Arc-like DNA binding domain-containing protein n=1 Tax=Pseudomonas asplenii TaxID=53407 RepID=A0A1H6MPF8_9PSED|nr:Arc-like DNA binding domain-containing protein [Pseudomonas fuscovaginae]